MRALLLFVIGLMFGGAGGFLAAGGMRSPDHGQDHHAAMQYSDKDHAEMGHGETGHDHSKTTAWDGDAPDLTLALSPDMGRALNLHIMTSGFVFAPEQVNGAVTPGTGHAHVYMNGEKVARAYSPWMHLENVPAGATIRVTLNANDHSHWAVNDAPLAAEITAP